MKAGMLVWNIALTLLLGWLLFLQFGKKNKVVVDGRKTDQVVPGGNAAFRIAYFEMDSVENNYEKVKDVKQEIRKKDEEYNIELGKLDYTYQKKVQEYQQKGSTMTQSDYEKAQMDLKQLENSLKNKKQDLDNQYQDFVLRSNLKIKKQIEDFLAEYNKNKNYSYIVAYEQGLFYYKDTVYDITSDVIRGLNEQYKNTKD